jgi:hypothetical protein
MSPGSFTEKVDPTESTDAPVTKHRFFSRRKRQEDPTNDDDQPTKVDAPSKAPAPVGIGELFRCVRAIGC